MVILDILFDVYDTKQFISLSIIDNKIFDDSNICVHKLYPKPVSNLYFYKIQFHDYKYENKFKVENRSFCKEIVSATYNIYVCIDIDAVCKNMCEDKQLQNNFDKLIKKIQESDLNKQHNYNISPPNVKEYINDRYMFPNEYICDNYYVLNNNYVYDAHLKKIVTYQESEKNIFKRKGCIFQTNNVKKFIESEFFNIDIPTLIIMPTGMVNYWKLRSENFELVSFADCTDLVIKLHLIDKKYEQIIIHELHNSYIESIKNIAVFANCNFVWIINSLPLRYYFSTKITPIKISINKLIILTNLWVDLDKYMVPVKNVTCKTYSFGLYRFLVTKLQNMYCVVNYENSYDDIIKTDIVLSKDEKYIHDLILKYYNNWLYNLTTDPKNRYSTVSYEYNNKILHKINNTFFLLLTSIFQKKNISEYFYNKIDNLLKQSNYIKNEIKCMITNYETVNKVSNIVNIYSKFNSNKWLCDHIKILDSKIKKLSEVNSMYEYHKQFASYNKYDTPVCLICDYCNGTETVLDKVTLSEKYSMVKYMCGHGACLECFFGTLSNNNRCHLCNCCITVDNVVIIEDQIVSSIITYLNTFTEKTLVVTSLRINDYVQQINPKIDVLNIRSYTIHNFINKNRNFVNLIILCSSDQPVSDNNEINSIVEHYKLFNVELKVIELLAQI